MFNNFTNPFLNNSMLNNDSLLKFQEQNMNMVKAWLEKSSEGLQVLQDSVQKFQKENVTAASSAIEQLIKNADEYQKNLMSLKNNIPEQLQKLLNLEQTLNLFNQYHQALVGMLKAQNEAIKQVVKK